MKCSCRSVTKASTNSGNSNYRATVCGYQIQGEDCLSNIIYQCRLIGAPVPIQNCPYGCYNGRCLQSPMIREVSLKKMDKPSIITTTNNITQNSATRHDIGKEDSSNYKTTSTYRSRLKPNNKIATNSSYSTNTSMTTITKTTMIDTMNNDTALLNDGEHEVEFVTFHPVLRIPINP